MRSEVCVWGDIMRAEVGVWGDVMRAEVGVWGDIMRAEVGVWVDIMRSEVCVWGDIMRAEVGVWGDIMRAEVGVWEWTPYPVFVCELVVFPAPAQVYKHSAHALSRSQCLQSVFVCLWTPHERLSRGYIRLASVSYTTTLLIPNSYCLTRLPYIDM